jgi:uncharacterized protein (DUF1499 family)
MRLENLLLCSTLALATLGLASCSGKPPPNLGIRDGKLSPCPDKPNCVSSQAADPSQFVEPLVFSAPASVAQVALLETLSEMEGATVMTAESFYVRAEFTSDRLKFVDDVEFLIDPLSNIIHVRSASRLGYSDLGVNRKRVELIRTRLNQALQAVTRS